MIKNWISQIKRNISIYFFYILNGQVKIASSTKIKKFVKSHYIKYKNNKRYRLFEIKNCRMYYNKISDVAFLKNNYFLSQPSFQIKNFIHRSSKENYVFKNGTPAFKKNFNKTIFSTLYTTAASFNYWHWVLEVLPKIAILEKSKFKNKIDFFLFPALNKNFQTESLDLLKIPKLKRISADKFNHISAKRIISCDHPFIKKNQLKEDTNIPYWLINWVKKKFVKNIAKKPSINIYIDRGDSKVKNRQIVNEEEIKEYLKKKNFKFIKLSNCSFKKQIKLFSKAKCVIGLHGAGFVNIIFCKKGTKIVELSYLGKNNPIEILAKKNSLKYHRILPNSKKKNQRSQDIIGKYDVKALQRII